MRISLIKGDITKLEADAIVNAANSSLLGGGGVDGAIHRAAGSKLLEECKKIRKTKFPEGLPVGQAVITLAYDLPARYVIHTVGPVYKRDDISLLGECYLNSLKLAEEHNCASINFPAISAGAYGVPIGLSAKIVNETLAGFESDLIRAIGLVLFSENDYNTYRKYFK